MVYYPQVSPPKPCIHHRSPPYAIHASPTSFFWIWSPAKYWVRNTDQQSFSLCSFLHSSEFTSCCTRTPKESSFLPLWRFKADLHFYAHSLAKIFLMFVRPSFRLPGRNNNPPPDRFRRNYVRGLIKSAKKKRGSSSITWDRKRT